MRLSALGLLLGLASAVSALSATGNRVLVVSEDETDRAKYSVFIKDIESKGYELEHRKPRDTPSLFRHGVPAYDHLVLLPTKSKSLGQALSPKLIVDFINAGSNVLVTLSATTGVPVAVSSLLQEMDISLAPERESYVVDHFAYDSKSAAETHDVLVLDGAAPRAGVRNFFDLGAGGYLALPRAVGQVLGNASPLLQSVVKAPATAYVHDPKGDAESAEEPFATGAQISLVTAFQGRNSARLTVVGSAEALEDKWLDASTTVQTPGAAAAVAPRNKQFADALVAWTFHETGVLKTGAIRHWLTEDLAPVANASAVPSLDVNPDIYRIKNDVHYEIEVSEWDGAAWVPFVVPAGDNLQLEFSMLSPFHRLNLKPKATTATATVFEADFRLPDQHGIFNFFVEYRRPFFTNVEEKNTVTVRHFAHDEWPRSWTISGAWPWISGIWVTVAGWLAFVALWLYSKPTEAKKNLKSS